MGAYAAPKMSYASGAHRRMPQSITRESAASSRANEYSDRWLAVADRYASGGHSDARTQIVCVENFASWTASERIRRPAKWSSSAM